MPDGPSPEPARRHARPARRRLWSAPNVVVLAATAAIAAVGAGSVGSGGPALPARLTLGAPQALPAAVPPTGVRRSAGAVAAPVGGAGAHSRVADRPGEVLPAAGTSPAPAVVAVAPSAATTVTTPVPVPVPPAPPTTPVATAGVRTVPATGDHDGRGHGDGRSYGDQGDDGGGDDGGGPPSTTRSVNPDYPVVVEDNSTTTPGRGDT